MVQRGRMAGDRPRGRAAVRIEPLRMTAPMWDALEGALKALALACFAGAGWVFADLVDPRGELMRWTLGWVVGEFR